MLVRKIIALAVAVFFVLALCQKSKAEMIWSDGFESGNFSAWASVSGDWSIMSSTTYAHSGSKRASVKGPSTSGGDILLLAESSTGYKNITFEYWYRFPSYALLVSDHVSVDYSLNSGSSWQTLTNYIKTATGEWTQASFSLPAFADNNSQLEFRVLAQLSGDGNRMWFDDFALAAEPIPEPTSVLIFLSCFLYPIVRRKH